MESTVIIALITALTAIIAPLITAIVNNRTAIKLKEIEAKGERQKNITLHEREVLENALMGMAVLIEHQSKERFFDACTNTLRAMAYVDDITGEKLRKIVSVAREQTPTMEEYSEVCISLKKAIEKRIVE